uniref:hypothetical protein n=1 Tax=uncultured Flavobacterium sp. TaxID=165435 RepID=UPI0025D31007
MEETEKIPSIEEMKNDILLQLEKKFPLDNYTFKMLSTTQEAEDNGFILKRHADRVIQNCATKFNISFRKAGAATLNRVKEGNPCKGHN